HDTLQKIATANGVTVAALRKANPNVDPKKLRPNMKLVIPAALPVSTAQPSSPGTSGDASGTAGPGEVYTVKSGDTLTKIARAHHVTTSELRAANNLKTSEIRPNQKLKIPAAGVNGTNTPASTRHTKSRSSTNVTNTLTH